MVLILVSLGLIRFGAAPATQDGARPVSEAPGWITANQQSAGRQLYNEMTYLFADQFRWLAEFNGRVDLAVEPIPGGVPEISMPVQYRLLVMARGIDDPAWRTVWRAELLLLTEEWVQVQSDGGNNDFLSLWVHSVGENKAAVDTALSLTTPTKVTAQATHLQTSGRPTEVLAWREGQTEYRLLQTIAFQADHS